MRSPFLRALVPIGLLCASVSLHAQIALHNALTTCLVFEPGTDRLSEMGSRTLRAAVDVTESDPVAKVRELHLEVFAKQSSLLDQAAYAGTMSLAAQRHRAVMSAVQAMAKEQNSALRAAPYAQFRTALTAPGYSSCDARFSVSYQRDKLPAVCKRDGCIINCYEGRCVGPGNGN
jgi:hypothetical protein